MLGNDNLFHCQYIESHGGKPLGSGGFKEILDCRWGNKEAWINVSIEHDVIKNYEIVYGDKTAT